MTTMTCQHFALIAETIKAQLNAPEGAAETRDYSDGYAAALEGCAHAFAQSLRTTNPNFNRERFLRACGVES